MTYILNELFGDSKKLSPIQTNYSQLLPAFSFHLSPHNLFSRWPPQGACKHLSPVCIPQLAHSTMAPDYLQISTYSLSGLSHLHVLISQSFTHFHSSLWLPSPSSQASPQPSDTTLLPAHVRPPASSHLGKAALLRTSPQPVEGFLQ